MGIVPGIQPTHQGGTMSEQLERLREIVAATKREIDTEFETASLAMMRAVVAFQRCESEFIDARIDSKDIDREMGSVEPQHRVAVALSYVLREIATSPTGVAAAAAVIEVLDDCEIERHASDGKAHPPTRDVVIKGLTALIDERQRQLHGLVKRAVTDVDPKYSLETDPGGIGGAYRAVQREQEAFVLARDLV